jgi:hypothetical protein
MLGTFRIPGYPVILRVIHHGQNPSETISLYGSRAKKKEEKRKLYLLHRSSCRFSLQTVI